MTCGDNDCLDQICDKLRCCHCCLWECALSLLEFALRLAFIIGAIVGFIIFIPLMFCFYCLGTMCGCIEPDNDEDQSKSVMKKAVEAVATVAGLRGRTTIPGYWKNAGKNLENALDRDSPEFFDDMYPVQKESYKPLEQLMNDCVNSSGDCHFRLVRAIRIEDSVMWANYQQAAAEVVEQRGTCTFTGTPLTVEKLHESPNAKDFASTLDTDICECYLWHATNPTAAMCIVEDGFRIELAGSSAGTRFGKGSYFAEDSAKSNSYAKAGQGLFQDCYAMLLCRVVLGNQYVVNAGFESDATDKALPDHDSTLAQPSGDPREFVIFDAHRVYPEYALVYERMDEEALLSREQSRLEEDEEAEEIAGSLPSYWVNNPKTCTSKFDEMHPAIRMKSILQDLMDATWLDKWTRDRKGHDGDNIPAGDPHGDMPLGVRVLKVLRVEDSDMWKAYCEKQDEIRGIRGECSAEPLATVKSVAGLPAQERNRLAEDVNEVYLWHGSNPLAVMSIAEDGFNIDLSGSATGAMFGKGAYFAECSSKADEYSRDEEDGYYKGYYAVLLCRVTLGDVQVLTDADNDAHERTGPDQDFDSTIGDRETAVGTYREFVIPEKSMIYPEYAVIYERIYSDGRLRGLKVPRRQKAAAKPLRDPDMPIPSENPFRKLFCGSKASQSRTVSQSASESQVSTSEEEDENDDADEADQLLV